jgi:hypothetical protein
VNSPYGRNAELAQWAFHVNHYSVGNNTKGKTKQETSVADPRHFGVDPDPDPEGPKTCGSGGSGSTTLQETKGVTWLLSWGGWGRSVSKFI